MRKKIETTVVERAIASIPGFNSVCHKLRQQVTLRGQSNSTLEDCIRRIAQITLHFGRLPEQVSDDEINEYLCSLALSAKSPSRSNFKHAVYGLRYYFRPIGHNKRAIGLPSLKKEAKLPVILNRQELRELFKAPERNKHRIVLALIYSAGLRSQEVVNLKLSDIDFERMTIHIRQSKYKKDRIVPLSEHMAKGLKNYTTSPKYQIYSGRARAIAQKQKPVKMAATAKPKETTQERLIRLTGFDAYKCPFCKQGMMVVTETLPKIRSPANFYALIAARQ